MRREPTARISRARLIGFYPAENCYGAPYRRRLKLHNCFYRTTAANNRRPLELPACQGNAFSLIYLFAGPALLTSLARYALAIATSWH